MEFTVYSKDGCPYCTRIKYILESLKLNTNILELDIDFNRENFCSKFGDGSTFPQVLADGKSIGGCVDTINYLKKNNIL